MVIKNSIRLLLSFLMIILIVPNIAAAQDPCSGDARKYCSGKKGAKQFSCLKAKRPESLTPECAYHTYKISAVQNKACKQAKAAKCRLKKLKTMGQLNDCFETLLYERDSGRRKISDACARQLTIAEKVRVMLRGHVGTTKDKCRSGSVIHVFKKYFDIDPGTQNPSEATGDSFVIRKGSKGVIISVDDDRWRWRCGKTTNKAAGKAGALAEFVGEEACSAAMKSNMTGQLLDMVVCPAAGYAAGELARGLLGNWEATRIRGARRVKVDFKKNGTIIWKGYKK
jgi:hypothetical protein